VAGATGSAVATVFRHIAVLGCFVLYAAVISYPLILDLGGQIPGTGAGDNVAFLWNFWWFREALADPELRAFYTQHLFAPFGTSLVLHTHTALPAFLGATLLSPLNVAAAHNVVLLGGLAANGAATYALAYHHVRRTMPSVLSGVVFAGSAYISIHLLGHFNLVHAWVLPTAALTWIRCLEAPRLSKAAPVAGAFAAAAYTDYYYLAYVVIFAAGWWLSSVKQIGVHWNSSRMPTVDRTVLVLMVVLAAAALAIATTGGFRLEIGPLRMSASSVRNPVAGLWLLALVWVALRVRFDIAGAPGARQAREYAKAIGAAIAIWLVLMLPLAIPAIELVLAGDYVPPPQTWRSGPRGIDLLTIVLGHPLSPLYGESTRAAYSRFGIDMMEQVGWIGIVPVVVIAYAVARRTRLDRAAVRWTLVAAFFAIWSLGAYLVVAGLDTGMPLPQALVRFVPFLSNARMPGRAFVMVQLASTLLCAIAATRGQWPRWAVLMLTAVAVADGASMPFPMYQLPRGGQIEAALAKSGARLIVVELPVGLRDGFGEVGQFDHRALVYQTFHHRPIAGGFVARLAPRVRRQYEADATLAALLKLGMGQAELPVDLSSGLLGLGITHVIVNTDTMTKPLRQLLEARGLRLEMEVEARQLYVVGDAR
jgi:hypothetical protein